MTPFNPFPHTTNLQQTTIITSRQTYGLFLINKAEHIVSWKKRECAPYGQVLPLSQCIQKSSAAEASESVCMWERVKRPLTVWRPVIPAYSEISD